MDPDIQALSISAPGLKDTLILNVYNEKDLQPDLQQNLQTVERSLKDIILLDRAIVCRDFNAHYPWWNSTANPIRAETLTTWLSRYNCELINIPDIVTYTQYSGNTSSVLDLTFATPGVYQSISDW